MKKKTTKRSKPKKKITSIKKRTIRKAPKIKALVPKELISDTWQVMERVIVLGDLALLTSKERVMYYQGMCNSLGLNPLTKPFEYIELDGKLTLYARKDATDQIRAKHNVNLTITNREITDERAIVTARAELPNGRKDESIGVVSFATKNGKASGKYLDNLIMKAETKAKRRVTLSIIGLGMVDESELDTVDGFRFAKVDNTGEIKSYENVLTNEDIEKIAAMPPEVKEISHGLLKFPGWTKVKISMIAKDKEFDWSILKDLLGQHLKDEKDALNLKRGKINEQRKN